jgi:hypothetical protein
MNNFKSSRLMSIHARYRLSQIRAGFHFAGERAR